MKHIKALVLLAAITLTANGINAQVSNADTMVHKLFTSLKNKDQKAFIGLYPNPQQFTTMMRVIMEQVMNNEQMQAMMAQDSASKNLNIDSLINMQIAQMSTPEAFAAMELKFGSVFQKIIEKGEGKGVDWSKTMLTSYTIDSAASIEDGADEQMLSNTGLKAMKGVIDFKAGDSAYQMSFDKIIFIPTEKGWFGGEFPALVRKGESLEKDVADEETTMTDSIAVATPKTKIKAKTKSKTPTTKTKTKTKAPARKPGAKS